jgi:hypothetical protein
VGRISIYKHEAHERRLLHFQDMKRREKRMLAKSTPLRGDTQQRGAVSREITRCFQRAIQSQATIHRSHTSLANQDA